MSPRGHGVRTLCLLTVLLGSTALAQEPTRTNWYGLPQIAGWALSSDTMTLIVSDPERGALVLIDTTGVQGLRRVDVDFKPTALAVQSHTLYAAAEGSGLVYAVD